MDVAPEILSWWQCCSGEVWEAGSKEHIINEDVMINILFLCTN